MPLLAVVACQSPLSPSELRLLAGAEHRWAARGFSDYSVETSTSCFCPPELTGWTRIEVVGGQVRKATLLETGEVITDMRLNYWSTRTVEALFASIRASGGEIYLADVKVTFDRLLGFPTLVRWIAESDVLDGGRSVMLRNAQQLP